MSRSLDVACKSCRPAVSGDFLQTPHERDATCKAISEHVLWWYSLCPDSSARTGSTSSATTAGPTN